MNTTPVAPRLKAENWQHFFQKKNINAGADLFLAIDIDGTLLRHNGSLSTRTKVAFQAHIAAGTQVILATGRGISGAQSAMQELGYADGYAVCSNGAIILAVGKQITGEGKPVAKCIKEDFPPIELIAAHTFNPEKEIATIRKEIPNVILAVESLKNPRKITEPFPEGELTGISEIIPITKIGDPQATRLTVRTPQLTATELTKRVKEIGLHGVEYAIGWSAWLDITPAGISKATGLADVLKKLTPTPKHTISIGDSGNDCEMLQWAEVGIAMDNAPDYVKEYADVITSNVNDDGVAEVLEGLL